MAAAKPRPGTALSQAAVKRATKRKALAAEEAAMMREAEALLARVNRGLDELHTKLDRMLAHCEA
jgi:hypothetical protein